MAPVPPTSLGEVSSSARILVVLGTIVALVIAFVVLSPDGDDDEPPVAQTQTQTQAQTTPATTTGTATTEAPRAEPQPQPTFRTVRVRDGKPVGGIEKITFKKGDRARIQVTSPDTSDEIHVHGYDLYGDVKPGARARFVFDANAEGIFEIELHGTGTKIAELVVEPR